MQGDIFVCILQILISMFSYGYGVAEDEYGNQSEPYLIMYQYESCKLSTPVLSAEGLGWRNKLSWDMTNTKNLAGYIIYRKDSKTASYREIGRLTEAEYTDNCVEAEKTYWYKIEAVDKKGNSVVGKEISVIPIDEDDIAPIANAGINKYTVVGKSVVFNGENSSDNRDRITKYEWDLGDNTYETGCSISHSYDKEGTYIVSLKVYDSAGNVESDTITVTVRDSSYCMANLHVTAKNGKSLKNVMVYCEGTGVETNTYMTDENGKTTVFVLPGEYDFYFCKDGYLPTRQKVTVPVDKDEIVITLEEQELVTGEFEVKELGYSEMKSLGIDIYAPENQHVFEYTMTLEKELFDDITFCVNTSGEVVSGSNSFGFTRSDGRRTSGFIGSIGGYGGFGGGFGGSYGGGGGTGIWKPSEEERVPTIAVLTITASFAWTKEFYDVELTIINNANEEFSIENAVTTLNLPDGLSIADSCLGKEMTRHLGNIIGGTSKTATWIVRGDKAGEYDLTADFSGVLMPFEKTVTAAFKTSEPIHVDGENALSLKVYDHTTATSDYWDITYIMTNVSSKPVYGVRGALSGFTEFGKVTNIMMIYPNGKTVCLEWNGGFPDESTAITYFDIFMYDKDDGEDTLKPGESVIISATWDLSGVTIGS